MKVNHLLYWLLSCFCHLQGSDAAFLTGPAAVPVAALGITSDNLNAPLGAAAGNLAAWLQSLRIPINQTISTTVGGHALNVTLKEFGSIFLKGISHKTDAKTGMLQVDFLDVGFQCDGSWEADGFFGKKQGGILMLKTSKATFGATMLLHGAPGFLTEITLANDTAECRIGEKPPCTYSKPMCTAELPAGSVDFEFTGGLPEPVRRVFASALDYLVRQSVQASFCAVLAQGLEALTPTLHKVSIDLGPYTTMPPPASIPEYPRDSIRLNETQLLGVVRGVMENTVMNAKSPYSLTQIMQKLDGKKMLVNKALVAKIPGGSMTLNFSSVEFDGLSSIHDVNMLSLLSAQTFGAELGVGPVKMAAEIDVIVALDSSTVKLVENVGVQVNFDAFKMQTIIFAKVHEKARDYISTQWQNPICLAQAFSNVGFQVADVKMTGLDIKLSSLTGGTLDKDVMGLFDDTTGLLTQSFGALLSTVMEDVLGGPARDAMNVLLFAGLAKEQEGVCVRDDTVNQGVAGAVDTGTLYGAYVALGLAVLAIIVGGSGVCKQGARDRSVAFKQASCYAFPLFLIATLCIYVSGKTSHGMLTAVRLTGGDQTIQLALEDVSFFGIVHQLWNDHMYWMAGALMIFSGCIPFVRLLVLFLFWFFPQLGGAKRGTLLLIIDAVGKFMFLDTFNFVLEQSTLYNCHDLPGAGFAVFQRAQWGEYGLTIANMMSLVAGHYVREVHRREEIAQEKVIQRVSREVLPDRPRTASFSQPMANTISLASKYDTWKQGLVTLVLVAVTGLAVAGWLVVGMRIEFHGAAGKLLFPNGVDLAYLDIFNNLPHLSDEPGAASGVFFQALWIALTLLALVADQVVLMVIWLCPLTLQVQTLALISHQILHCWSSTEVMLMGVLLMTDNPADNPDPIMRQIGQQAVLQLGFWLTLTSVIVTTITGLLINTSCENLLKQRRLNQDKLADQPA